MLLCCLALGACLAPRVDVRGRAVRQRSLSAGASARRTWGLGVVASLTLLAGQPLAASPVGAQPSSAQPTVHALVRAALRCQRRGTLARADRLYRRARLSGLVPRLRLSARRGQQQDLSATSGLDVDRLNTSTDDELTLEAGLTFQLDRLVFAPEQVRLLRLRRGMEADRRRLAERVIELYFALEQKRVEQRLAPGPTPELEIEVLELTALLDAYTGGAFSGESGAAAACR